MIDWYIEISDYCPPSFKTDKYLKSVIDITTPIMNYFSKRLSEIENWSVYDANKIFSDIIDEVPIFSTTIYNGEFIINYNKWTVIKLTDNTNQIYRGIKLEKILNNNYE
jgi:hypothetical protein